MKEEDSNEVVKTKGQRDIMYYPRAQLRVLEGPTGTTGTTTERVSSKTGPLRRPEICCLVDWSRFSERLFDEGVVIE